MDGVAFRVRKSHGLGKELQRASELSSFSRSHSPTEHTLHPMSKGDDFPDLVAKNGEFRYMVVRIRYYCCPFARFRLKMTSEMFANGRFWAGDSRQGHTGIPEHGKTPVFPGSSGLFDPHLTERTSVFTAEGMTNGISEWRRCRRYLRLSIRVFLRRVPTWFYHQ